VPSGKRLVGDGVCSRAAGIRVENSFREKIFDFVSGVSRLVPQVSVERQNADN